ncbi:hypothetical protein GCM10023214_02010 [Amycolatopsis dongchuanensis]|uniref:Uncharacterized protein n=1 Tax=Amycolatopsis dongchuanensis TaxID=1070866 RepID=A0ABP9PSN7_9PSEU
MLWRPLSSSGPSAASASLLPSSTGISEVSACPAEASTGSPDRAPNASSDEVDRADDEFEAFLLELLAEAAVTIPELGTRRAVVPPIPVLTSNRTRELHDALKRRCLYQWIAHPDADRVAAIIRLRVPEAEGWLAERVARSVRRLRGFDLAKPPGVAEAIDWAAALHVLGVRELDEDAVRHTLSAVVKYEEDRAVVEAGGRWW